MGGSGSIIAMIKSMEANRKMMRGGSRFSKKNNSTSAESEIIVPVSKSEARKQRLALKEKVENNLKTKVIMTTGLLSILSLLTYSIVQISHLF